jgi:hypothetical protein
MLVEIGELKVRLDAGIEIEQTPRLEIAGQDVARLFCLGQSVDIIERLDAGFVEV